MILFVFNLQRFLVLLLTSLLVLLFFSPSPQARLIEDRENFDYFYANSLQEAELLNKKLVEKKIIYSEDAQGNKKFSAYQSGKISPEYLAEKSYERKHKTGEPKAAKTKKFGRGVKRVRLADDPAIYRRVVSKSSVGLRVGTAEVNPNKRLKTANIESFSLEDVKNNARFARIQNSQREAIKGLESVKGVVRSARMSAAQTVLSKRENVGSQRHFLRTSASLPNRSNSRITRSASVSLETAHATRGRLKTTKNNQTPKTARKVIRRVSSQTDTIATLRDYRAKKRQAYEARLAKALENPVELPAD